MSEMNLMLTMTLGNLKVKRRRQIKSKRITPANLTESHPYLP